MPNTLSKSRIAAFKRQNECCYYCDMPIWLRNFNAFAAKHGLTKRQSLHLQCTAERLVARQDGGTDGRDNIVAACRFCNLRRHRGRSAPSPETYQKQVQRRLDGGRWHTPKLLRLREAR
jgi:hypothetical protein